jgi:drug/metabolite transporter (DMT)-like permease
VRAAAYMCVACLCFAAITGIARHLSATLHAFEIAFFRALFGLLFLVPFLIRGGVRRMRSRRLGLHVVRGVVTATSMVSWFYALTQVPLADAVALSFTMPLFAAVIAVVALAEPMHARRWGALAVGFAGSLVILDPDAGLLDAGGGVVLVSSLAAAISIVMVKVIARDDPAIVIVAYISLFMVPASLVPALFHWQWPQASELVWLAALGAIGSGGHLASTRALALADTTAVMPYDFTRLPFTAAIAYVAFAETPTARTWIGAGMIFAAAFYIATRERRFTRATPAAGGASPGDTG